MIFLNHYFFNIFNNFIKNRRDIIIIKALSLINYNNFNFINKFFNKQFLFYSLRDNLYKLSLKKIIKFYKFVYEPIDFII